MLNYVGIINTVFIIPTPTLFLNINSASALRAVYVGGGGTSSVSLTHLFLEASRSKWVGEANCFVTKKF